MKILIKNANLISMSEKREQYEKNIDILINNDTIEKIGKNMKPKELVEINETSCRGDFNRQNFLNKDIKVIDATGKVVMPGLINTHAHIPMSIFRETIDGYGLQEWLEERIWPMEDKLTNKDIYYATYLSCIEMIKTGCTTINDMYFMTDDIIKAVTETGVRIQTTRTLMSGGDSVSSRLNELDRLIEEYNKNDLVSFNAGIHGLYTTKEEDTKQFIEYAKNNSIPVHMHFCENSKEVCDIINSYTVNSPVEVLKKYFTDIPLILAHAVKLTEKEIEELSTLKNISISHCPISNLKLGCGVAKIQEMLDKNINVSLGTDGQGSGSNLDMFETMKFAALLQKGINENPKDLTAYEVIKMATINGAKALNMDEKIGSIEEGKKADIIVLDMNSEIMQPINNVFADIVYNANGNNVETTIVNGKILMESRVINCANEGEIYKECEKIIERIK